MEKSLQTKNQKLFCLAKIYLKKMQDVRHHENKVSIFSNF